MYYIYILRFYNFYANNVNLYCVFKPDDAIEWHPRINKLPDHATEKKTKGKEKKHFISSVRR